MRSHPTRSRRRPPHPPASGQEGNARAASLGVFLGLAVLGAVIFYDPEPEAPPPNGEPGSEQLVGVAGEDVPDAKGPDWQLPAGDPGAEGGSAAALPTEPDPVTEPTLTFRGTPVEDGQVVPTAIPYRKGDRNRYKLTNTVRGEDKATGNARGRRETRWMTTEVVSVTDSGGARIRVTFDALRMQMLLSAEFGFTYDSRDPDARVLEDPRIAALVRPALALLDIPVEFELNADGTPVRVRGVDALRDAFLSVLPKEADPAFAPSDEQQLRELGGLLFPTLGREIVAGTGRKYSRAEDTGVRYDIIHEGELDVISADPGSYVVQSIATPKIARRSGPPRSENEAQVVEAHIVSDAGSSTGKWRIDREARRLDLVELRAAYELWLSFKGGPGNPETGVGEGFTPVFTIVDQLTTLEYLPPQTATADPGSEGEEKPEAGPDEKPDQGAAPTQDGTHRQASGTDQGESTHGK